MEIIDLSDVILSYSYRFFTIERKTFCSLFPCPIQSSIKIPGKNEIWGERLIVLFDFRTVFKLLQQHTFCSEWSCPTYLHGSTTLTATTTVWARFWMDRTIAVTYCTGLPGLHSFHQTDSMFWWQPRELKLQIQLTQDSPVYLYTFSRIKQHN